MSSFCSRSHRADFLRNKLLSYSQQAAHMCLLLRCNRWCCFLLMWEGVVGGWVGQCVGVNEATSGVRMGITKPDNKTVWWHCWLFTISYPYISCRHGDCLGWYRWMQSSSLYLVNMKDDTPYLHCILLCKVLYAVNVVGKFATSHSCAIKLFAFYCIIDVQILDTTWATAKLLSFLRHQRRQS